MGKIPDIDYDPFKPCPKIKEVFVTTFAIGTVLGTLGWIIGSSIWAGYSIGKWIAGWF